jgi:hypothetical protein
MTTKILAALLAFTLLAGCEWIKLHVKGSERGIDWGVGVPL